MKKLVKIFLDKKEKELLEFCKVLVGSMNYEGRSDFILTSVSSVVDSALRYKIQAIDEYIGQKYIMGGMTQTFDVVNIYAISKNNPKINLFSTYSIILDHETGELIMSKIGDWRI